MPAEKRRTPGGNGPNSRDRPWRSQGRTDRAAVSERSLAEAVLGRRQFEPEVRPEQSSRIVVVTTSPRRNDVGLKDAHARLEDLEKIPP